MMDPQLKARWCEALRSGEYTQASSALRRVDCDGNYSHCCLGVLADLINPSEWEDADESSKSHWARAAIGKGERSYSTEYLPGSYVPWESQVELGRMNDGDGQPDARPCSFAEIADYIERNL